MLRALLPGLNEWAVHPALDTQAWRAIEPDGWRIRLSDHAFLTSGRASVVLAEADILVIDYRRLQDRWRKYSQATA